MLYYSELLNHGSEFYTIFLSGNKHQLLRTLYALLYMYIELERKKMRHSRLCLHDAHMQNVQKCAASQNATMAQWGQKLSNKTLFLKSTPEISRGSWIVTFYISTMIKNFVIISWNCWDQKWNENPKYLWDHCAWELGSNLMKKLCSTRAAPTPLPAECNSKLEPLSSLYEI